MQAVLSFSYFLASVMALIILARVTKMLTNYFNGLVFFRILNIEYWFDGPIGFSLASIGLVFNTIAIYTLGKQVCHKTFHSLMMLLLCWDFGLLFFSQFLFALPELSESYKNGLFLQLVPYLIPMAQICLSGSCFTTVALTVER